MHLNGFHMEFTWIELDSGTLKHHKSVKSQKSRFDFWILKPPLNVYCQDLSNGGWIIRIGPLFIELWPKDCHTSLKLRKELILGLNRKYGSRYSRQHSVSLCWYSKIYSSEYSRLHCWCYAGTADNSVSDIAVQ